MDPEDYEYYEEWKERDYELEDISLEEYDNMRCMDEYGPTKEEMDNDCDDNE